ncbi:hypothetical protein [Thiohalorhabdus sp.]|uniref:hypothetical protein n=1 Tax=Thiohalorhabdus sp. TaxID=3094134 RepID=UPI002FC280BF
MSPPAPKPGPPPGRLKRLSPDRFLLVRFYRAAKWTTLLVLVLLGGALVAGRYLQPPGAEWPWLDERRTLTVEVPMDWPEVAGAIQQVFSEARDRARRTARTRLDAWHAELMGRVKSDFLPWYFDFWNQEWRDLKATGYLAADWAGLTAADKAMLADFRDAFSVRVMPPAETQLRMEAIAREALGVYLAHAREELPEIPKEYGVPREDWQEHMANIGLQLQQASTQDEQVPTTLKGLVTFGAAGTTAVILRGSSALSRVGAAAGRWSPRAAAGAGETALVGTALRGRVARTGGRQAAKTSARVGGRILGVAALAGFLAWDVYDYRRTEAELRPKLRQRLDAYLRQVSERMLADPETGVLAPVQEVQGRVHAQLADDP